ncbi:MAG: ferrochelatase [Deltaproteobacteria bacterium]|nr:ferrochelatase [Deltaproteobacteria bacterium]
MIGILLINLGTPLSAKTSDVRKYLKEFLSDPYVIDINPVARWFLVNFIIAPFRSPRSAEAYQSIWKEEGSPLLFYTQELGKALQSEMGEEFHVEIAMRYGEPNIKSALLKLKEKNVEEIRAIPLYPQYAASSTGSTLAKLHQLESQIKDLPTLKILRSFFDHEGFINSFSEIGKNYLANFQPDHILFSFHGLPVRHILKQDIGGNHCFKTTDCCEKIIPANGLCYRAHCFQSAREIGKKLKIPQSDYSICFQSRLGRTPWIEPFTDILIEDLAKQNKKRLLVFCPSFVADCLETLEEIGIRARSSFIESGGEDLMLVPSLNAHPTWVKALSNMLQGK